MHRSTASGMKERLRAFGVACFRLLPSGLRRMIVGICADAAVSRDDVGAALRETIRLYEDLASRVDAGAIRYEGGLHPKHRLTGYHGFFTKRLRTGDRVLDIGCGNGALAFSMAEAGARVTGIDVDPENIAVARSRFSHPRLDLVIGNATEKLPEGRFEVVVLSNVQEHIRDRVAFLCAVREKVRPRRWLIRVPLCNRDWLVAMKQDLGLCPHGDPGHFIEYTQESFEKEISDAGLAVYELQTVWGEIWAELRSAPGAEMAEGTS